MFSFSRGILAEVPVAAGEVVSSNILGSVMPDALFEGGLRQIEMEKSLWRSSVVVAFKII
jgi:hypothetical protein